MYYQLIHLQSSLQIYSTQDQFSNIIVFPERGLSCGFSLSGLNSDVALTLVLLFLYLQHTKNVTSWIFVHNIMLKASNLPVIHGSKYELSLAHCIRNGSFFHFSSLWSS